MIPIPLDMSWVFLRNIRALETDSYSCGYSRGHSYAHSYDASDPGTLILNAMGIPIAIPMPIPMMHRIPKH